MRGARVRAELRAIRTGHDRVLPARAARHRRKQIERNVGRVRTGRVAHASASSKRFSVCSLNMADLAERVADKIAEMERYLARTGGHVELVDVEDAIARIRVSVTRPRTGRLVATLQLKSGIERALLGEIPELRGVEAINLPPYTVLGWDQPGFTPIELPQKDGS
jgi:Fe-S cluster biogenesis protein NfuA